MPLHKCTKMRHLLIFQIQQCRNKTNVYVKIKGLISVLVMKILMLKNFQAVRVLPLSEQACMKFYLNF